jgi:NADPH:quinone reductase-like Zn-dependent oxidoreductase
MIRAVVRTFGAAADVVDIERCRPAALPPGHVRVRMRVCSINPSDLLTIAGVYASRTPLPFVPGFEGVGVVEEAAADVTDLAPGDRVLPIGGPGAWQEAKTAEARWCFGVDPALSDDQATTSYVNPLTAWLMVERYVAPGAGARVAVNAAASTIGRVLVRLLRRRGAEPVALARGDDPPAELDVAFDAVGGPDAAALARRLRPGGTLVRYGLLSGVQPSPDPAAERPDIAVDLFWLRRWVHAAPRPEIERAPAHVFDLVRDGTAATPIEARYPLPDVRDALLHHDRPGRRGKILLDI